MYMGIQESPVNQLLKIYSEVYFLLDGPYSHHICRKFTSAYLKVLGIFWVCFILFILSYLIILLIWLLWKIWGDTFMHRYLFLHDYQWWTFFISLLVTFFFLTFPGDMLIQVVSSLNLNWAFSFFGLQFFMYFGHQHLLH